MSSPAKDKKPGLLSSPKSSFWTRKKKAPDNANAPDNTNPQVPTQVETEVNADGQAVGSRQVNGKAGPTRRQKAVNNLKSQGKKRKKGGRTIANSGDFIGRLGALIVMVVTTINTTTVMVTSFIEEIYWIGGIHAFLLAFVHLPVIIVMIWLMCRARVQSVYRKVRPGQTQNTVVEDVASSSSSDDEKEKKKKDDKNKNNKDVKTDRKSRDEEKMAEAMRRANRGQQINQAFNMA